MPYAQGMNMVLYCCKMMKGKINLDNGALHKVVKTKMVKKKKKY